MKWFEQRVRSPRRITLTKTKVFLQSRPNGRKEMRMSRIASYLHQQNLLQWAGKPTIHFQRLQDRFSYSQSPIPRKKSKRLKFSVKLTRTCRQACTKSWIS
ncbi:unnamed protein product [Callosobruchus maculatus]|uniref:Uncharacterized protein n=1 Tax=Callosobruchus maculatus TaxID=64391 RepID=A0A653DU68_CALMS|nr:unnamed protein product [Callosobruchus maculatus]